MHFGTFRLVYTASLLHLIPRTCSLFKQYTTKFHRPYRTQAERTAVGSRGDLTTHNSASASCTTVSSTMEPGADWTTSDAILPVSFGVQYDTVDDLPTMIQEAQLHAGATFVVIPLASESSSSSFMPSTKSDLCLTSQQWYTHVVGCVTGSFGNAHLLQQLDWAKHLALTAVLCDGPGDLDLISYASTLMALVRQCPTLQWWIPVEASAYTRWNRLMALCDTVTSHINPVRCFRYCKRCCSE